VLRTLGLCLWQLQVSNGTAAAQQAVGGIVI
jgi:hypothetical protein